MDLTRWKTPYTRVVYYRTANHFWLISGFHPFQHSYEIIFLIFNCACFVGLLYLFNRLTAMYPALYLIAFVSIAVSGLPEPEAEDV